MSILFLLLWSNVLKFHYKDLISVLVFLNHDLIFSFF